MSRSSLLFMWTIPLMLVMLTSDLFGQKPPYDVFPPAKPPYYRVRYEASTNKGELVYPVNYTIWIPKSVKALRGVIVHQHGCGEGSCKSGLTGAYDLHWQALAKKHDCALLAPSYEQPGKADCQMWCDPRNGSSDRFQQCLIDLGKKSGHPELSKIPWALWGHSGGGHWAGGMVLLHPERVAAAWLRSGVPLLKVNPKRKSIKVHTVPDAALKVPIMSNLGTKEGVTVKNGRFSGVWPANETFFNTMRGKGSLIGVSIDPLTSHECGNQRYMAIPWLDACLTDRLPKDSGGKLRPMPTDKAWLAPILGGKAVPAAKFTGNPLQAGWLPNEAIAKSWMQYVKDTKVSDSTPPPTPTNVRLKGNQLTWEAEADLESGLAGFIIERNGKFLAKVPEQAKNRFGRPIFQNLQYSDTPTQPLVQMRYIDSKAKPGVKHSYRVIAVNTVGFKSRPAEFGKTINYLGKRQICLMPESDEKLKQLANELLSYLNQIDTAQWSVANSKDNTGIVLALTETANINKSEQEQLKSMSLEGYLIKPEEKVVHIVGNTSLAVQHAMFDFLERLGCRFLTPAEAWTVIPKKTGLKIAAGKSFVQPDFTGRRIWYANGLGVGHSPDGSLKEINETYKQFYRRIRQVSIAPTSFGHSYYGTYLRHRKTFDAHPEWAGMRKDGSRPALNTEGGPKANRNWCYSNPELAELCLQDRIKMITEQRKTNPHCWIVSMDTNDGARPCYCDKCRQLGNATDQALHLANYVARGIRKVSPNVQVGMLIYPPHILPPENVRIEPNILPSMAMAFNRTELSYAELVQGWIKAGAKQTAVYEYFGVYEWDFGMPAQAHVRLPYVKKAIPHYYNNWHARIFSAQSQASWGRYGPSMYVANKLLWDVNADADEIYSEYFTAAFGKAALEMRKLFEFWDTSAGSKLTDVNIARWLAMMQRAQHLAESDSPEVKRRLEDMLAYLHTVVLYFDARAAQSQPSQTEGRNQLIRERVGKMLDFIWRTRRRQMIQFWGFMTRMGYFGPEIHSLVWKKWVPGEIKQGTAEWMTSSKDYSSKEIHSLFGRDLKRFAPALEQYPTFSNDLVPMFPDLKPEKNTSRGSFSTESVWYFAVEQAGSMVISLGDSSPEGNYFTKAIVVDSKGKTVFSHTQDKFALPDRSLTKLKLTLQPGLYRMTIADRKRRYYPVFTPPVRNVYEQSNSHSTFNQYFTPGFFYVPKGVKELKIRNELYLSLQAPSWKKMKSSKIKNLTYPVGDDDGKVWELKHVTRANFALLNVPPYVANRKANLLVPRR